MFKDINSYICRVKSYNPEKRINHLIYFFVFLLIILPIITGYFYVCIFAVNIPYWDQWNSDIFLGLKIFQGNASIIDFFQLHNDHRPVFPYIIMTVSHILSKFNIITEVILSYFLYIFSFLILALIFIRNYHFLEICINKEKCFFISLIYIIPVSFYYFNFFELGSLLWGLSIFYSLYLIFVTLMFYSFTKSSKFDYWFLLSIICAICCMFTFSSGLFIWIGGVIVIGLQRGVNFLIKITTWIVSAVLALSFNYLILGFTTEGIHSYSSYHDYLIYFYHYPIQKICCFFGTIGSNIIHDYQYSLFFGIIIGLLIISVILFNRNNLDLKNAAVWYGMIGYSFILSILLTLSRSGNGGNFGPANMILFVPDIRHFPSTILLLISFFFLVIHYYLINKKDLESGSNCKNFKKLINNFSFNCFFVGILVLLLFLGFFCHLIPGITYGDKWFNEELDSSQIFLNYHTASSDALEKLHPDSQLIMRIGDSFKKYHLNLFVTNNPQIYINQTYLNKLRESCMRLDDIL